MKNGILFFSILFLSSCYKDDIDLLKKQIAKVCPQLAGAPRAHGTPQIKAHVISNVQSPEQMCEHPCLKYGGNFAAWPIQI